MSFRSTSVQRHRNGPWCSSERWGPDMSVSRGSRSISVPHTGDDFSAPSIWEECAVHRMSQYIEAHIHESKMQEFCDLTMRHGTWTRNYIGAPAMYEPVWKICDAVETSRLRWEKKDSQRESKFKRSPISHNSTFSCWLVLSIHNTQMCWQLSLNNSQHWSKRLS